MSRVQAAVLCEGKIIDTFCDFSTTEKEQGILKDEKKHHGTVDESSPEQQFCKSDAITFVV